MDDRTVLRTSNPLSIHSLCRSGKGRSHSEQHTCQSSLRSHSTIERQRISINTSSHVVRFLQRWTNRTNGSTDGLRFPQTWRNGSNASSNGLQFLRRWIAGMDAVSVSKLFSSVHRRESLTASSPFQSPKGSFDAIPTEQPSFSFRWS